MADPILSGIVSALDQGAGSRIGVTLWVSGQMLSGDLGSASEYFQHQGGRWREYVEGVADEEAGAVTGSQWSSFGDLHREAASGEDYEPAYVHLFDPVIHHFNPSPMSPRLVPINFGSSVIRLWMGAIDGFLLGKPS